MTQKLRQHRAMVHGLIEPGWGYGAGVDANVGGRAMEQYWN